MQTKESRQILPKIAKIVAMIAIFSHAVIKGMSTMSSFEVEFVSGLKKIFFHRNSSATQHHKNKRDKYLCLASDIMIRCDEVWLF